VLFVLLLILKIIIGIFCLGLLVFIHELGHFTAAKAFKFKVLAFSIGFGKSFFSKKVGDTDYRLGMIPFGGYVKMAGENPEEERQGSVEEFQMKPKYQRAIVAAAGPVANFLSAILMLWIMFMIGVDRSVNLDRSVIGFVDDSSAAKTAGIQAGDSIISVNGRAVHSWEDLSSEFLTGTARYEMAVVRNGKSQTFLMQKDRAKGKGYSEPPFGVYPITLPIIGFIQDSSPAQKAGLKVGDTILAIDTFTISWWEQISVGIQKSQNNIPREIKIGRQGMRLTVGIVPAFNAQAKRYQIGISPARSATYKKRYSAKPAFDRCREKTWEYTTLIFKVIGNLFSRQVSPKDLAGPVGIISIFALIALAGFSELLNFLGLISINLAVLNLFPLIITDGGVLLFLLLEAIRGKPLSLKTQIAITRFAIAFFIVFFLYVTMNDINRLPQIFRMFGR
jgi:regulator of sigma E protease